MYKSYDNFEVLTCDTSIKEKDDEGYYSFYDTVFYGEKGGQLSDEGTINGLNVIDLKWVDDVLFHKVDGDLVDPIHMEVNENVRYLNTTIQSAFHLLDGYYAKKGLYIPAIGVNPDNQWYEVNTKEFNDEDAKTIERFINDIIKKDIKTKITYMKGSDYSDPNYHKFDELHVVESEDIDKQPCGTLHVNKTSQIQSFTILDYEKTSRGTKVHCAINEATTKRLKELYNYTKNSSKELDVSYDEAINRIKEIQNSNKDMKKEIINLKKDLMEYKANELANSTSTIINYDTNDPNDLRLIGQALLSKTSDTKIIYTNINDTINLVIISNNDAARKVLDDLKIYHDFTGGG